MIGDYETMCSLMGDRYAHPERYMNPFVCGVSRASNIRTHNPLCSIEPYYIKLW